MMAALQFLLMVLIGEYLMNMSNRIGEKPYVVEDRLINFDEPSE
jgi:hypothetical protein